MRSSTSSAQPRESAAMNSPRAAPLTILAASALLILDAWLCFALWAAASDGDSGQVGSGGFDWSPPTVKGDRTDYQPKPIEAYSQTLARPIFARARQPWSAPPAARASATAAPAVSDAPAAIEFTVAGVTISSILKQAFLVSKARPEGLWVTEGGVLGGWTVSTITPTGAVLRNGERSVGLRLYPEAPARSRQ